MRNNFNLTLIKWKRYARKKRYIHKETLKEKILNRVKQFIKKK